MQIETLKLSSGFSQALFAARDWRRALLPSQSLETAAQFSPHHPWLPAEAKGQEPRRASQSEGKN